MPSVLSVAQGERNTNAIGLVRIGNRANIFQGVITHELTNGLDLDKAAARPS